MGKKRIKVKELAKELGVTSHEIVARCLAAALPVQNSITLLKPHVERTVRTWFAVSPEDQRPGLSEQATGGKPLATDSRPRGQEAQGHGPGATGSR